MGVQYICYQPMKPVGFVQFVVMRIRYNSIIGNGDRCSLATFGLYCNSILGPFTAQHFCSETELNDPVRMHAHIMLLPYCMAYPTLSSTTVRPPQKKDVDV